MSSSLEQHSEEGKQWLTLEPDQQGLNTGSATYSWETLGNLPTHLGFVSLSARWDDNPKERLCEETRLKNQFAQGLVVFFPFPFSIAGRYWVVVRRVFVLTVV